jgi:hypothetical protein
MSLCVLCLTVADVYQTGYVQNRAAEHTPVASALGRGVQLSGTAFAQLVLVPEFHSQHHKHTDIKQELISLDSVYIPKYRLASGG